MRDDRQRSVHIPDRKSDDARYRRRIHLHSGSDHLAQRKLRLSETSFTPPDTNSLIRWIRFCRDQNGALNGDSSVTPLTGSIINYNYAIARVRMKGSAASAPASNVNVFFRLFTTQTFDTDFINSTTATTQRGSQRHLCLSVAPRIRRLPLPGTDGGGASMAARYHSSPPPISTTVLLTTMPRAPTTRRSFPAERYTWAFFGCFLNVNDASNEYGDPTSPYGRHPVQYWLSGSAHNCLVAQVAYEFAPIENSGGVIEYPGNSDKLAQRNLQVTTSGNPGFPATHRVPQTIDVRPSPPPQSAGGRGILSYPDEMMIDWGRTPVGSVASIYWPEVSAASVVKVAQQLYPAQTLTVTDAHTIQCTVGSRVTYIPIPSGSGGSYACLMTIELPALDPVRQCIRRAGARASPPSRG